LQVELPDGTRFAVGTGFSDLERHAPPAIGSLITFRYQELSEGGVPRFPTYVGVREDVAWPAAASAPALATPVSAPTPAPPAAVAASPGTAARRFEWSGDGSSKFWEIEVDGSQHTVRFGRIGTSGQAKTKTFASADAANRDAEALISEKTRKGYRQTSA
jgi:DNA ligase-1